MRRLRARSVCVCVLACMLHAPTSHHHRNPTRSRKDLKFENSSKWCVGSSFGFNRLCAVIPTTFLARYKSTHHCLHRFDKRSCQSSQNCAAWAQRTWCMSRRTSLSRTWVHALLWPRTSQWYWWGRTQGDNDTLAVCSKITRIAISAKFGIWILMYACEYTNLWNVCAQHYSFYDLISTKARGKRSHASVSSVVFCGHWGAVFVVLQRSVVPFRCSRRRPIDQWHPSGKGRGKLIRVPITLNTWQM